MKLIMESWKKFTESLNEQEQKTSDVQKSEPKPSSAKKFKYEDQLSKDPADRESLLMQMTPEGKDYLLNKIPFSLKFDIDTSNKKGIILITVQSKLDSTLMYSRKFSGLDIGDIDRAKRVVMRDFFKTNSKALEVHRKMEDEKYATFKKAWGHYWLTKQKQANAPAKKIQQDTKKAIEKSVKKAETKIKPEKITKTPEVVKVKKAAAQKKATPVNAPMQKKQVTSTAISDQNKKKEIVGAIEKLLPKMSKENQKKYTTFARPKIQAGDIKGFQKMLAYAKKMVQDSQKEQTPAAQTPEKEVAASAPNDVVKKVQSGNWTKGGKSFPKANPEVINLIYKLQGLIGAKQDGVFGKETARAIRRKYYGK